MRVANGKALITDGPFAGTKAQLAGYYILYCANLDEAIEWAATPRIASSPIFSTAVYRQFKKNNLFVIICLRTPCLVTGARVSLEFGVDSYNV